MKTTKNMLYAAAAAVWLTAALTHPLAAQNKTWNNTGGGDYGEGSNWSPAGVPGSANTLIFDLNAAYQVDFDADRSATKLSVRDGTVTFDIGDANTFTLTDLVSMEIGLFNAVGPSTLSLISGTTDVEVFHIGESGNTGILNVSGQNTVLNAVADSSIVGKAISGSSGTLNISNGAKVNTRRFVLADGSGTSGALTVTGTGSALSTAAILIVGRNSGASALVSAGAAVSTDTGGTNQTAASLSIGPSASLSTMTVDAASLNVSQSLRIADGGTSTANGELILQNGATVTVANEMVVGMGTGAGHAEMRIAGSGTTLQVNASAGGGSWIGGRVASDSASGQMVVEDGAAATFVGALNVREDGRLVIDGAAVTAGSFFLREGEAEIAYVLNSGYFTPMLTTGGNANLNQDGAIGVLDLSLEPGFSAAINDTFTLISYGGSLNGTFDGYGNNSTVLLGNYEFTLNYGTGSNSAVTLTTTAIPEPAHFAAVCAALAGIIALRRRRRTVLPAR